jgi:hypothetical protein
MIPKRGSSVHWQQPLLMKVAFVLGILLLCSAAAQSSNEVTFDSTWWNGLSQTEQLDAVQAAIAGISEGFVIGMLRAQQASHNAPPESAFGKYYPAFSHTFGYYQSAVTDFYITRPEASRADIGSIMQCLSDKPFFSCSEVAKMQPDAIPSLDIAKLRHSIDWQSRAT